MPAFESRAVLGTSTPSASCAQPVSLLGLVRLVGSVAWDPAHRMGDFDCKWVGDWTKLGRGCGREV